MSLHSSCNSCDSHSHSDLISLWQSLSYFLSVTVVVFLLRQLLLILCCDPKEVDNIFLFFMSGNIPCCICRTALASLESNFATDMLFIVCRGIYSCVLPGYFMLCNILICESINRFLCICMWTNAMHLFRNIPILTLLQVVTFMNNTSWYAWTKTRERIIQGDVRQVLPYSHLSMHNANDI